ncbi:hypothetical protein, partial [Oenococcus oeni]|uniref:hypothetical protein n=1 Tax=Oenococcus oeni TaxID=1247 RepID=UPI001C5BC995
MTRRVHIVRQQARGTRTEQRRREQDAKLRRLQRNKRAKERAAKTRGLSITLEVDERIVMILENGEKIQIYNHKQGARRILK